MALLRSVASPSKTYSGFAIALGLSLILGFLNFLREPPLADFHGEWVALVCFTCAAGLLLATLPRRIEISTTLLLVPAVLGALLLVQHALGYYVYSQYVLFWLAYLAVAVLAMLVGQGLRAQGLVGETANRLAWALLIAAVLNSGSAILQLLRAEDILAPLVFRLPKGVCSVYGNIAQANHATSLAWLGIASALYLRGIGRLGAAGTVSALVLLIIGSALTASRMAWLFAGLVSAVVVLLPAWPAVDRRTRRLIAAMLLIGLAVASFGAGVALEGLGERCVSAFGRLVHSSGSGASLRLELWQQAMEVWRTSPWIGVGAFRISPTVYAIASLEAHQPLDIYAHNVFFQLLAEFGVLGAGALVLTLGSCGLRLIEHRGTLQNTDALFLVWLGVIGIHSMLEFPLWYMHFLLVFALVVGLLIRPAWSSRILNLPIRAPMLGLVIALLFGAGFAFYDYQKLDRLYWIEDQRAAFSAAPTREVRALVTEAAADVRLFRAQADHLLGLSEPITRDDLARKIEDADRLLAQSPHPMVMARRIGLAMLAGDAEIARLHIRRMFVFYPRNAPQLAGMMREFVMKRPDEFAAQGPILDEELTRAPTPRW